MSLQDCVAIACTYLDDPQLHAYITKLMAEVEDKGQIHGLFLTGLTDSGIKLLTNFVNQVRGLPPTCACMLTAFGAPPPRQVTYRRPV